MITVFSKEYCPYCSATKQFLDSHDIEYQVVDLENDREKMMEIVQISGLMTVPQIFDGDITRENLIGGYDDMMAKYKAGKIFQ
ncbi:glutaredoxin [Candidatus Gracilibacteria bacterium]|nr:glutaredoxin [Candidatus Gracilibacteria bacterium]